MLTDGAVRMIVLMNFHEKGFSPFTLAYIFLLYEFMGILTNFYGGWYGKKFGLSFILILGAGAGMIAFTEYVEEYDENISNGEMKNPLAVQIKTEMETESVQNEDLIFGV